MLCHPCYEMDVPVNLREIAMEIASLAVIKKELLQRSPDELAAICLRLGRFKKENKELLDYLLFMAEDESAYVRSACEEMSASFEDLPAANVYLTRKILRRILRTTNRRIRYSLEKRTELELRLHYCRLFQRLELKLETGTVLYNLYTGQLIKIEKLCTELPEDLQADYRGDIDQLMA